jgi:hypothetical protein
MPSLFHGFIYQERFYMESAEKAILDTLYFRKWISAQDELDLEEVDLNALYEMSQKYPAHVSKMIHNLSNLTERIHEYSPPI